MRAAAREREKTVSHSQLHSPLTGTLGLGYQDCETSVSDWGTKFVISVSNHYSGLNCLLRRAFIALFLM